MLLSVEAHELERLVRPKFNGLPARPSGLYAFALQMGFPPASEISCDFFGLAQSFVSPAVYPRYAAIVEKLTATGYPPDASGGFTAWVKYEHGLIFIYVAAMPLRRMIKYASVAHGRATGSPIPPRASQL